MINNIICNRYKILDHLGTGGMATVWLGYDTILDRKVAIKTFKIDANDTDAVKGLIERLRLLPVFHILILFQFMMLKMKGIFIILY